VKRVLIVIGKNVAGEKTRVILCRYTIFWILSSFCVLLPGYRFDRYRCSLFSWICRHCDKPLHKSLYPLPQRVAFSFLFMSTFTSTYYFQCSWNKNLKRYCIFFTPGRLPKNIHHIVMVSGINTEFLLDYGKYQSGEIFRIDLATARWGIKHIF